MLWIAGSDDAILARPAPSATFGQVPVGAAVLALRNGPADAERSASFDAFAQLSGQSNGGQIGLPALPAFAEATGGCRFPRSLKHAAGMPVSTSRWVGVFRPPVRLSCPPEVTLATLDAR